MFKKVTTAENDPKSQLDPQFQYIKQCAGDLNLVLPILNKIRGKTLCLQSYTLSQGHANALAAACPFFDDSLINRVLFENCGIDDNEFAAILRGLEQLNDFKSIVYKQNCFSELSLEAITPLLKKRLPKHIEELRFLDCKISGLIAD